MNELLENLISLLSTQFSDIFKSYNYGLVVVPGDKSLPMISVSPVSTIVSNSGTVKDRNLFTVKVTVLASLKQYLNNVVGEGTTLDALQALVEWVEDRESTGEVKATSIIGVIRQNITTSGAVLYNNEITVDYEDYLDEAEFPKIKATITFTAESRSNRA